MQVKSVVSLISSKNGQQQSFQDYVHPDDHAQPTYYEIHDFRVQTFHNTNHIYSVDFLGTEACMGRHTLSSPMTSVQKVKAMTYMIDMPHPIKTTGAYVASFRSGVWK